MNKRNVKKKTKITLNSTYTVGPVNGGNNKKKNNDDDGGCEGYSLTVMGAEISSP